MDLLRLTRLAAGGDREAFGSLYRQTFEHLSKYVHKRVYHYENARDLISNVYCIALKKITGVKQPVDFIKWLKCIAFREILHYCRRYKKCKTVGLHENIVFTTTEYMNLDKLGEIRRVARNLKPVDRFVFEKFYDHGVSSKAIANMLGESNGHVRLRLHRSRGFIRGVINERQAVQENV